MRKTYIHYDIIKVTIKENKEEKREIKTSVERLLEKNYTEIIPSFKNVDEAIISHENKTITLHEPIDVRMTGINSEGLVESRIIRSTLGRFIFNEIIPQDLGFVDRSNPDNFLELEINFLVGKKQLKPILERCINIHGATQTAELLDGLRH